MFSALEGHPYRLRNLTPEFRPPETHLNRTTDKCRDIPPHDDDHWNYYIVPPFRKPSASQILINNIHTSSQRRQRCHTQHSERQQVARVAPPEDQPDEPPKDIRNYASLLDEFDINFARGV